MDTSTEYIKMCNCPEIQERWIPKNADFVKGEFIGYIKNWEDERASLERFSGDKETFGKYAWYSKNELVWLPRQDQLQEMIQTEWLGGNNRFQTQRALIMFNDWWGKGLSGFRDKDNRHCLFDTFEQCWLAIFMKEKSNKTWNGEDWI